MCDVGCGRGGERRGRGGDGVDVIGGLAVGIFVVVVGSPLAYARGSLVFVGLLVVFEFDGVVDVGGIGGVEDGDGAAAFFGGVFGVVHGVDEFAEGLEAGVGEFGGVGGEGGHGGLRGGEEIAKRRTQNAKGGGGGKR